MLKEQRAALSATAQGLGLPLPDAPFVGARPLLEEASLVSLAGSPFRPRLHNPGGQGVSHMFYCSQPRPLTKVYFVSAIIKYGDVGEFNI